MKAHNQVGLAAIFFLLLASPRAGAQLSYSVTDLGTLGGATSTANGVVGQGHNAAGMIVGSSTASDNSEHAFLYTNGQMFDLNALCDLSTSDFAVLTVAKTISDSCLIIGEGVTTNGEKHAFLLTPIPVDGGQWSYVCCQWVWIQEGGGWWWETGCGCYRWHGPPKGRRPACPPEPPHCWWYPLPCPPECGCTPPNTPPPPTTPTPPKRTPTRPPTTPTPPQFTPTPTRPQFTPNQTPTLPPAVRRSPTPFNPNATPTPSPTRTFVPGVLQTPTPTRTPRAGTTPKRTPTPTPQPATRLHPLQPSGLSRQLHTPTATPRRPGGIKPKPTPTPTPTILR